MNGIRADLHTHSWFSDGKLTPEAIAETAKRNGVKLIALTDHDTMQGSEELVKEAQKRGLQGVRGVEISAYRKDVKMHTLGYGLDIGKFGKFEKKLYENSLERTQDILNKLNKLGVRLTMDDVNAQRHSLTSPVHVTAVVNALINSGYGKNFAEVFEKYLSYGKPAYSGILRPTPEEAIAEIIGAGGIAVLAHPGRITMDKDGLEREIRRLKDGGLCGIEVYYTTHTEEKTAYYKRLAESLSLVKTGGSDTHYATGSRQIGKPVFYADDELLEKLKID